MARHASSSSSSLALALAAAVLLLAAAPAQAARRALFQAVGGEAVDMSAPDANPPLSFPSNETMTSSGDDASGAIRGSVERPPVGTPKRLLLQVVEEPMRPGPDAATTPSPLSSSAAANATESGRRRVRRTTTPAIGGNTTALVGNLTAAAESARALQNSTDEQRASAAVIEAGRRRRGAAARNGTEAGEVATESVPKCDDKTPPGDYSCAQQKEWGKCTESWMIEGGFCRRTCSSFPCADSLASVLEDVAKVVNATYPTQQQAVEMGGGGMNETSVDAAAPVEMAAPPV
jgi:hypothetical protein